MWSSKTAGPYEDVRNIKSDFRVKLQRERNNNKQNLDNVQTH